MNNGNGNLKTSKDIYQKAILGFQDGTKIKLVLSYLDIQDVNTDFVITEENRNVVLMYIHQIFFEEENPFNLRVGALVYQEPNSDERKTLPSVMRL